MKKMRNVLSTAVAFSVLFGAGTAFAEETKTLNNLNEDVTVEVEGELTVPTIDVTVPTSATFDIDPYNVGGDGQIVSTTLPFTNNSTVDVSLTLTGFSVTPSEGITLAAAPVSATSTKKEVFLYLDKKDRTDAFLASADKGKVVKSGTITGGQSYGTITGIGNDPDNLKTAGKTELKFFGNANDKVNWADTDNVKVTPTFKIAPVSYTTTPATSGE